MDWLCIPMSALRFSLADVGAKVALFGSGVDLGLELVRLAFSTVLATMDVQEICTAPST